MSLSLVFPLIKLRLSKVFFSTFELSFNKINILLVKKKCGTSESLLVDEFLTYFVVFPVSDKTFKWLERLPHETLEMSLFEWCVIWPKLNESFFLFTWMQRVWVSYSYGCKKKHTKKTALTGTAFSGVQLHVNSGDWTPFYITASIPNCKSVMAEKEQIEI